VWVTGLISAPSCFWGIKPSRSRRERKWQVGPTIQSDTANFLRSFVPHKIGEPHVYDNIVVIPYPIFSVSYITGPSRAARCVFPMKVSICLQLRQPEIDVEIAGYIFELYFLGAEDTQRHCCFCGRNRLSHGWPPWPTKRPMVGFHSLSPEFAKPIRTRGLVTAKQQAGYVPHEQIKCLIEDKELADQGSACEGCLSFCLILFQYLRLHTICTGNAQ